MRLPETHAFSRFMLSSFCVACLLFTAGSCGKAGSLSTALQGGAPNSEGAPSSLEAQLESEMARLGVDPAKAVAAAPGSGNAVFDLRATLVDPDGDGPLAPTEVRLSWTERLVGDYDQNGEVAASDLSTLGLLFGSTVNYFDPFELDGIEYFPTGDPDFDGSAEPPSPPSFGSGAQNWRLARVDGDYNGELAIGDVTPIAQHFAERMDGYRVYRRAPHEEEFTLLVDATPEGELTVARGSENAPLLPFRPVRYSFSEPVDGFGPYEYYVAPYDLVSDQEGPASGLVTAKANTAPSANVTADPASGREPLLVAFDASNSFDEDGDIVRHEWDWDGDGTYDEDTGTDFAVSHSFGPGDVTVGLRVTDDLGATATATVDISVVANEAPVAIMSLTQSAGNAPMTVQFDGSPSTDADGEIVTYQWDFDGNGVFELNTGSFPKASHTYETGGTFNAVMRVTDNDGATATDTTIMSVQDAVNAVFTATTYKGYAPLRVIFDADDSTASAGIAEYRWNFDGGDVDETGFGPWIHIYDTPGFYDVTLEVEDTLGQTDTFTRTVEVQAFPEADLISSHTVAAAGTEVFFNASNSTVFVQPRMFEWDLDGDGTFSEPTDVATGSFIYETEGTFDASVRVTDGNGASDTAVVQVKINEPPDADLVATVSPSSTVVELSAAASTDPDGYIVDYLWDFEGDGIFNISTGTDPDISHNYAPGNYDPVVQVTDNDGFTSEATVNITVNAP